MITELTVKNVQKHKNLTIKFTKGLNVIIGDTGAGKTALIRALNLTLMNQPRNGESIFQRKFTKDPLEIQIKDNEGNIIKRTKRKYYVNNNLIKAFGINIPTPIVDLFPLKEINWQRQHDPPFLIFQTGGTAAKLLNDSTGMEDQELLIKETKSQISEHKSNINRLIKNNQEQQTIIKELRLINHFLMKAKIIKSNIIKANDFEIYIEKLNSLINKIKNCKKEYSIQEKINPIIITIDSIELSKTTSIELEKNINKLNDICKNLQIIKEIKGKSKIYNKLIDSIISIQSDSNSKNQFDKKIQTISYFIKTIQESKRQYNFYSNKEKQLLKQFDKKLFELGECPLCGTKFKKGHIC